MANAKNNSTVLGLNMDCCSANGPLRGCKQVNIEIGSLFAAAERGLLDGYEAQRSFHAAETTIEKGKMHIEIEGNGCKTAHGTVKEIKNASAIIPPRVLNYGGKPVTKFNGNEKGMNRC